MRIENTSLSCKTIGTLYNVDGRQLSIQYKELISGYNEWEYKDTADAYVIYPENIGPHLSIDETCLSQGEVYTIVTNKERKGKKGSLVAMIHGTKSEQVVYVLKKISAGKRYQVKEVTLDLSTSMKLIVQKSFPQAIQVSDRFHVQKLMNEALDSIRVDYRWKAQELENNEIQLAREMGKAFKPHLYKNGDTQKQLLFRCRHLILTHSSKWTDTQKEHAEILFKYYPLLEKGYELYLELVDIYNLRKERGIIMIRMARWYDKVEKLCVKNFNTVLDTMKNNYNTILNYFSNRSTNASAESFNAKIKAFRSQFRGVRDIPFFIFRLTKLFA